VTQDSKAGYQTRQVSRETKSPWPLGVEQFTPSVRDVQLNIFCRHVFP
jgi:hypothetical protein